MRAKKSALKEQAGGSHYKDLAIQPVEFITANKIPFIEGNIVKYVVRHARKDRERDVKKVLHYAQLLLEIEYGIVSTVTYVKQAAPRTRPSKTLKNSKGKNGRSSHNQAVR